MKTQALYNVWVDSQMRTLRSFSHNRSDLDSRARRVWPTHFSANLALGQP